MATTSISATTGVRTREWTPTAMAAWRLIRRGLPPPIMDPVG
jgi:hypothetical protein